MLGRKSGIKSMATCAKFVPNNALQRATYRLIPTLGSEARSGRQVFVDTAIDTRAEVKLNVKPATTHKFIVYFHISKLEK